jgi:alkylated DNA repair dioxygenase AlkB
MGDQLQGRNYRDAILNYGMLWRNKIRTKQSNRRVRVEMPSRASTLLPMQQMQQDLFDHTAAYPAGFRYQPDLIGAAEADVLVREIERQDLAPFDFHGFLGRRRVVSFGWSYRFDGSGLGKSRELPSFLLPVRTRAASAFGLELELFEHALVTEYQPGAPIGWHKDRPQFGDVIGISLVSPCTFRFRKKSGPRWQRRTIMLEPNSAYLLQGPSRTEWEHSIPPVEQLRYSITFRSLQRRSA